METSSSESFVEDEREPERWSVANHDKRISISDSKGKYSFDIFTFLQRGKIARHLTFEEKLRLASHVVKALNAIPENLE
jgi:hypothetical protein